MRTRRIPAREGRADGTATPVLPRATRLAWRSVPQTQARLPRLAVAVTTDAVQGAPPVQRPRQRLNPHPPRGEPSARRAVEPAPKARRLARGSGSRAEAASRFCRCQAGRERLGRVSRQAVLRCVKKAVPTCRHCGSEVEAAFRFCPWCAAPQRSKLVEFFRAHPLIEGRRSMPSVGLATFPPRAQAVTGAAPGTPATL